MVASQKLGNQMNSVLANLVDSENKRKHNWCLHRCCSLSSVPEIGGQAVFWPLLNTNQIRLPSSCHGRQVSPDLVQMAHTKREWRVEAATLLAYFFGVVVEALNAKSVYYYIYFRFYASITWLILPSNHLNLIMPLGHGLNESVLPAHPPQLPLRERWDPWREANKDC